MKKRELWLKAALLLALALCMMLIIRQKPHYERTREFYAFNFIEDQLDIGKQPSTEVYQEFIAKDTELETINIRFTIENLVELDGYISVCIFDEDDDMLASRTRAINKLTQTELARWTTFQIPCELEKGKLYRLRLKTSQLKTGGGSVAVDLSNNRQGMFGTLTCDEEVLDKRLVTTFEYHVYCDDDLVRMLVLLGLVMFGIFLTMIPAVQVKGRDVCCKVGCWFDNLRERVIGNRFVRDKKDGVTEKEKRTQEEDDILGFAGEGKNISGRGSIINSNTLLILTPVLAFHMMQSFCSYYLPDFLEQLFSVRGLINVILYSTACLVIYVLTSSAKLSGILVMSVTYLAGLINAFVWDFRECPIMATDLASIGTAKDVAAGYEYHLNIGSAWATVLFVCYVCICLSLRSGKKTERKRRAYLFLAAVLSVTGVWGVFFHSDLMKTLDISVSVWMPQRDYAYNGSALSFLLSCTYYIVEKPEGYSAEAAEEIAKKYPSDSVSDSDSLDKTSSGHVSEDQTENTAGNVPGNGSKYASENGTKDRTDESDAGTPNIIAIMNESFADLSVDCDLKTSEDPMPFIHGLTEDTVKGNLYVSVLGGNTANTEFEFLTGNTLGFFPMRSVPYNSYLREETASLTHTLKAAGYTGMQAVHPYFKEGWSREIVYPLLGFESFLSQEDFEGKEYVRDFLSDRTDYKKLIELFEENRKMSDRPIYQFSVTMQNHGGYFGTHGLTEETIEVLEPAEADDQVTQYVNLVKESDTAFEELVHYFQKVKEPTVIIMFGDHQPGFSDSAYDTLMGREVSSLGIEDTAKMYQVPYLIWANYDIEEEVKDMSANYLSSYLLKVTGGKMTGYNKYLLELQEKLPVISAICYMGDDGVLHSIDEESEYSKLLREYQILQYNNLFDAEHRVEGFFYLR